MRGTALQVPSHRGEGERISIAFNVAVTLGPRPPPDHGAGATPDCGAMLASVSPACGLPPNSAPLPEEHAQMCASARCVRALRSYAQLCSHTAAISLVRTVLAQC
jgi:hypothetical protein